LNKSENAASRAVARPPIKLADQVKSRKETRLVAALQRAP
jgi:hypothetical protein